MLHVFDVNRDFSWAVYKRDVSLIKKNISLHVLKLFSQQCFSVNRGCNICAACIKLWSPHCCHVLK